MSSPSSLTLQRLYRLDRSSPGFHDRLSNVLYGEEYKRCVPNLQGDGLVWLVDYLDETLNGLDSASSAFRKCLRELRHICGTKTILPTSYTLSSSLLNIDRQPVASGGSGDIYKGTLNGSSVCVKRVRIYSKDGPKKTTRTIYQEAIGWKRLSHTNIVPLLGITPAPLQLISEWMPGGDLGEYIKKHPGADQLGLLSDVAGGLHFLHSCNIVHGDLKGPSILVDVEGHARITDFGLATVTQNLDSIRSASDDHGHTARWTAPEILNEQGTYSKEADVFSFAMVMIEVYTGAVPFSHSPPASAMLAIRDGTRPPRPIHSNFTEQLWALMQRCWDQDPHLRPEVSEVEKTIRSSDPPAWKQLISYPLSTDECISLLTSIFADRSQVEAVGRLSGDDAQVFVDAIHEALDSLPQQIRRRCLRSLSSTCGRQALLPRSLTIPLCYNPTETPQCYGGFADVWEGQYQGVEVAVKVLRVYSTSDLEQTRKRFCREVVTWKSLRHPNVLPLLGVTMTVGRFAMVSEWMENGTINEFVKTHVNVNKLELLGDITRGLIYMHDQGIIHGNLMGSNVLIDSDGRARLAGLGLVTIASDRPTNASPAIGSGTFRWMSPELIYPETFGLKENRPTKESDCYALGMVIYEVLSGRIPFAPCNVVDVISMVLRGERPSRPQGEEGKQFTDDIWEILERCWKSWPRDRINAKAVLLGREGNPSPLRPPSNEDGDVSGVSEDQSNTTASESVGQMVGHGDEGLPVPPHVYPKQGWIGDWLVRTAWKVFNTATKQLHVL